MLSFKEAAIEILNSSDTPLSPKEIIDLALEKELIQTEGLTPEATMGAILYLDINSKKNSPFIKVSRGKFSLKNKKDSSISSLILLEKHNDSMKAELKEILLVMDPYLFEFYIADLLQKIGYEDIEVTKRSGDGGIDITANLTVGGITDVKTVIQVKRHKSNIPGSIITQLRGSAKIGERGLVITTSDFTKDALLESKATDKMPVSLVNGEKLLKLLFEYKVGIKVEEKSIYYIDKDYFENYPTLASSETGKNMSLWPLPGGTNKYIDNLNKFLEAVANGQNTKKDLIGWFLENYENVKSVKSAENYIFIPKSMGLSSINEGKYYLTDDGKKYYETKDLDLLYEIINKNIFGFEEIVEFLKNSDSPQKVEDIFEYFKENLEVEWTTYAQTTYRLLWLLNLKKITKNDDGTYSIRNGE